MGVLIIYRAPKGKDRLPTIILGGAMLNFGHGSELVNVMYQLVILL